MLALAEPESSETQSLGSGAYSPAAGYERCAAVMTSQVTPALSKCHAVCLAVSVIPSVLQTPPGH